MAIIDHYVPKDIRAKRIGLALSGGGVRGLAHIGVLKALAEYEIFPMCVAGTSVGSIIGAAFASGLDWREIEILAHSVSWPALLSAARLEDFCRQHFSRTFETLRLPFVAVATALPRKTAVYLDSGDLATAVSASSALRYLRKPVLRDGMRLADGGISCVLPSQVCRELGAEFIIASDVWERSGLLHPERADVNSLACRTLYPKHYRKAILETDLLIRPRIPFLSYLPTSNAVTKLVAAGAESAGAAIETLRPRLDDVTSASVAMLHQHLQL